MVESDMSSNDKIILCDGDSIAYKAGYCNSVSEMRQSINNMMYRIIRDCGSSKYELYIEEWREGKNLFRSSMTLETKSYKGNRKGSKPKLLNQAREYMKSTFNARVVKEYESEDLVLIRAYEIGIDRCIVAYIDKDLEMYSDVTFYNYSKRFMMRLTPRQAATNMWKQVLTGDSTDNIPGLRGYGPVKAGKALQDVSIEDMPYTAAKHYKDSGQPYRYFIEQYNLIWIRNIRSKEVFYPVGEEEWENL